MLYDRKIEKKKQMLSKIETTVEQKRKIILDCKTAENACLDTIESIGQSKSQKEGELEVLSKEILQIQA